MIFINDKLLEQEKFGDGTLKCNVSFLNYSRYIHYTITWCYDSDAEIFALWSFVHQVRDIPNKHISLDLVMPYIPHARQDRNVSERLFTLKYFAQIINELNFDGVRVLDPHSDVSIALLNNVEVIPGQQVKIWLNEYLNSLPEEKRPNIDTIMYPDNGAAKKYGATQLDIVGNKHRDNSGRISSYELLNFTKGTKNVLIVDDICSYGGTFVAAAKALRKQGVEQVNLLVSHCESNIFKGEVFDYIDNVYTTDSILDLSKDNEGYSVEKQDRIHFIQHFRDENFLKFCYRNDYGWQED